MNFLKKSLIFLVIISFIRIKNVSCQSWTPQNLINIYQNQTIVDTGNYLDFQKNVNDKFYIDQYIDELFKNYGITFYCYFINKIDDSYNTTLLFLKGLDTQKFLNETGNELKNNFNVAIENVIILLVSVEDYDTTDMYVGININLYEKHFFDLGFQTAMRRRKIIRKLANSGSTAYLFNNYSTGLKWTLNSIRKKLSRFNWYWIIVILVILFIFFILCVFIENKSKSKDLTTGNIELINKEFSKNENIQKIKLLPNDLKIEKFVNENCVICLEKFEITKITNIDNPNQLMNNRDDSLRTEVDINTPLMQDTYNYFKDMKKIEDLEKDEKEKTENLDEELFLNCSHVLHKICLIHKLKSSEICPICGEKILFYISNSELKNNKNTLKSSLSYNRLYNIEQSKKETKDLKIFLENIQTELNLNSELKKN